MIATLAAIVLGLAWLARETDWLRVRLLVGPVAVVVPEPHLIGSTLQTFSPAPPGDQWQGGTI